MPRITKEGIDRFFDYGLHVETRALYLGDGDDGEIDATVAKNVVKALHILGSTPDKEITVYLNSFGGCWFNGLAIFDAMKFCEAPITAYVIGSAMSMGSVVLQACGTRLIYPNATMMIHDGYETRVSDMPTTFINWAEHAKRSRNRMYEIYAERSGRTTSFWRRKCANDFIISAPEALELGLVDGIVGAQ